MPALAIGREFRDFLFKSNMFALALAVVIGGAVNKVVTAIIESLIMPTVGALTVGQPWAEYKTVVAGVAFPLGSLFSAILNFLTIALVVFLATKFLIKKTPPPPSKTCPQCKEAVHPDATRCKFCTSGV